MAENPLALGHNAPLSVDRPLSNPGKLGYVAPLGRNSALDQQYSSLTPADAVEPVNTAALAQVSSPDASQLAIDVGGSSGGDGGSGGSGSSDGGTGSGGGTGDGGTGDGGSSGDGSDGGDF